MDYLKRSWGGVAAVTAQELLAHQAYWREALYDRKMLVLRGLKDLTPLQLWELHAIWGRPWSRADYATTTEMCLTVDPQDDKVLTEYGNLLTLKSIGNKEMPWHRDIPWHRDKRYPIRSLYPVVMSNGAGETGTRFTDADALWERLDSWKFKDFDSVQVKIQSWYQVVHGIAFPETKLIPLIEDHPATKRKSVLLNSFGPADSRYGFSTARTGTWILNAFVGSRPIGLKLIEDMHRAVCTPDNTYVHQWELGDLVLFDNWSGVFHSRAMVVAEPGAERKFWRMNLRHAWQL